MNVQALAAAPKRSTAKASINLGLLTCEVSLYSGQEDPRTARNKFVRVGDEVHPVGNRCYDKVTGENVANEDIFKGVTAGDKIIEVTDEEVSGLGGERGLCQILGFMPDENLAEMQHALVGSRIYQVRATGIKVGRETRANPMGDKIFAHILQAMPRNNVKAIVQVTLRDDSVTRTGILNEFGRLTLLHFCDDLREDLPLPHVDLPEAECAMVDQLVEQHMLTDMPDMRNGMAARMADLIERKLGDKSIETFAAPEPITAAETDIQQLLAASIEVAEKKKKAKKK